MDIPHVNSELFNGQIPKELQPKTYYAYIDSIEKVDGITFLRLDCIEKRFADSILINKDSIIGLPSIVIEVSAPNQIINKLLGINGIFTIYNFESQWMIINTSTVKSELTVSEFFNFTQIGNQETYLNYTIKSVQLGNEIDNQSALKISELKSATQLTESPKEDILSFIAQQQLDNFFHVNVYNVGQGNCNALVDSNNVPLLYFDVGGGSGANSSSYPANFKLCHSNHPSVVLSHWDLDHIVTAVYDPQLLKTKWLTPVHASLSNTAIQIASALQRNGNLICWNASLGNLVPFGNHFIAKCNAPSSNKNSSGLSLYVKYKSKDYVLLPGDATFRYLPPLYFNHKLIGLVASHHGAKSGIGGMPMASSPGMLAFSFGRGNTHGHAHKLSRTEYRKQGWGNGLDTTNGSIAMTRGLTNLKPPCGGVGLGCSLSITKQF